MSKPKQVKEFRLFRGKLINFPEYYDNKLNVVILIQIFLSEEDRIASSSKVLSQITETVMNER